MNTQQCLLMRIPFCEDTQRSTEKVSRGSAFLDKWLSADDLRNKSRVSKPNVRVKFPGAEEKLFNKFKKLRKVGIKVDGNYLKAKMLKYVAMEKDADPKKSKGIQSN